MAKTPTCLALGALLLGSACSDNQLHQITGGAGSGPRIAADPMEVQFGDVGLSSAATETVLLYNRGTADLRLQDLKIDGAGSFTLSWPEPVTELAPGESTEVLITYTPAATGETGRLLVYSDDPVDPLLPVPLQGGAAYALLSIEPDPVDFGGMDAGTIAEEQARMVNLGADSLTVSALTVVGDGFSLVDAPALPLTLGPGEDALLRLRFTSTLDGWYQGGLHALSDAPAPQTSVALQAGVGVGAITGQICSPDGGGWVVGARVWVTGTWESGDPWVSESYTDAEGRFLLEQVPAGSYTVNVQKGSWTTSFEVTLYGGTYELPEPECLDPTSARVAVVTGEYDHIQEILSRLEIDYDPYSGLNGDYIDLLLDPDLMSEYDIIFFNCGMAFDWMGFDDIPENLRAYVEGGGSVYASDWAYGLVESSWPGAMDMRGPEDLWDPNTWDGGDLSPFLGAAMRTEAVVLDPTMQAAIGSDTAEIVYDLEAWVVIDAPGSSAVLVSGDVEVWNNEMSYTTPVSDAPLAVRFDDGGTVIYTTFHNDQQATTDMLKALEEIILSL